MCFVVGMRVMDVVVEDLVMGAEVGRFVVVEGWSGEKD